MSDQEVPQANPLEGMTRPAGLVGRAIQVKDLREERYQELLAKHLEALDKYSALIDKYISLQDKYFSLIALTGEDMLIEKESHANEELKKLSQRKESTK